MFYDDEDEYRGQGGVFFDDSLMKIQQENAQTTADILENIDVQLYNCAPAIRDQKIADVEVSANLATCDGKANNILLDGAEPFHFNRNEFARYEGNGYSAHHDGVEETEVNYFFWLFDCLFVCLLVCLSVILILIYKLFCCWNPILCVHFFPYS